jgi:hypothetical protein
MGREGLGRRGREGLGHRGSEGAGRRGREQGVRRERAATVGSRVPESWEGAGRCSLVAVGREQAAADVLGVAWEGAGRRSRRSSVVRL